MSEFKLFDRVSLIESTQTNQNLFELFRIAKEKYNQNYLYITNFHDGFFECSIDFSKCGVMASQYEIRLYNDELNLKITKQEFECGARINIPERNLYDYIYLTTIGRSKILVDKNFESDFKCGNYFEVVTVNANLKATTQKKITLKDLISRLNKKDGKILEQVMRDWNLLKSDETIFWE